MAEVRSLEASATRYNQAAHRLKLLPALAKRADGVSFELRINREASAPSEFANLDLKVWGGGGRKSATFVKTLGRFGAEQ